MNNKPGKNRVKNETSNQDRRITLLKRPHFRRRSRNERPLLITGKHVLRALTMKKKSLIYSLNFQSVSKSLKSIKTNKKLWSISDSRAWSNHWYFALWVIQQRPGTNQSYLKVQKAATQTWLPNCITCLEKNIMKENWNAMKTWCISEWNLLISKFAFKLSNIEQNVAVFEKTAEWSQKNSWNNFQKICERYYLIPFRSFFRFISRITRPTRCASSRDVNFWYTS